MITINYTLLGCTCFFYHCQRLLSILAVVFFLSKLQLREDVGGVEYTPTFLVVFFDDDKTTIAQYEGTDAIMGALASKRIHAVIQEFVRRRAKLKMAERMAGLLALRVAGMMIGAQQQQEARSTFEGRMRRLAEDSDRGDSEAAKKEKV